jgi:hypothetical protein
VTIEIPHKWQNYTYLVEIVNESKWSRRRAKYTHKTLSSCPIVRFLSAFSYRLFCKKCDDRG